MPFKDPETKRAFNKTYYQKNKETIIAEWRDANKKDIAAYGKKHKAAHRERNSDLNRERKRRDPVRAKWHKINGHAKERGLTGRIILEEFVRIVSAVGIDARTATGGHCPSCRQRFTLGGLKRWTLDHIHPVGHGGEHVISNCQILCLECNRKKGDSLPATISF